MASTGKRGEVAYSPEEFKVLQQKELESLTEEKKGLKVHIVAHGQGLVGLGGMKPDKLVEHLATTCEMKPQTRQVTLHTCYGAYHSSDPMHSYAGRFYTLLVKFYKGIRVKANVGYAYTMNEGTNKGANRVLKPGLTEQEYNEALQYAHQKHKTREQIIAESFDVKGVGRVMFKNGQVYPCGPDDVEWSFEDYSYPG